MKTCAVCHVTSTRGLNLPFDKHICASCFMEALLTWQKRIIYDRFVDDGFVDV